MKAEAQAGTNSVIINADDWGRSQVVTDRMLACVQGGSISSVSAMVFMEDSARAAALALAHGVDAGLHLNLTTPFTAPHCPSRLQERQTAITRFLRTHRLAPVVYHPGLTASFRCVVQAQIDEYSRLYGHPPRRVDGHHHMHLCANLLFSRMIPEGVVVRRNFTFPATEKSWINRAYRAWQDRILARRHPQTDFFLNLVPLDPRRLQGVFARALQGSVEVVAHPINDDEYRFLMEGGLARCLGPIAVARGYHFAGEEWNAPSDDL